MTTSSYRLITAGPQDVLTAAAKQQAQQTPEVHRLQPAPVTTVVHSGTLIVQHLGCDSVYTTDKHHCRLVIATHLPSHSQHLRHRHRHQMSHLRHARTSTCQAHGGSCGCCESGGSAGWKQSDHCARACQALGEPAGCRHITGADRRLSSCPKRSVCYTK